MHGVFEWLHRIDMAYDLSLLYALLSVCCALATLWIMQCLTRRAGFASLPERALLAVRLGLGALAMVWLLSAGMALYVDSEPWAVDVAERCILLAMLVVVPRLLGGRDGVDHLMARARRQPAPVRQGRTQFG